MAGMLGLLALGATAQADVGAPVEIRMPLDTHQAVSGEVFVGEFEVHVYRPGVLSDFKLRGEGWTVLSVDFPATPYEAPEGVLRIPFRAIPADADAPIGLKLKYNGRFVRQRYSIGPEYFSQRGVPRSAVRIAGTHAQRAAGGDASLDDDGGGPPGSTRGGAIPIHVVGRIVYTRAGVDRSFPPDGDFNDPGDTQPVVLGADQIDVRVLDDDDLDSETIWSGVTDEQGFFDTGVVMWDDCDAVGCDDPDLVVYFETERGGWVDVTDNSITEDTYEFETDEVTDFTGSFYDFGWITPADGGLHPAIHIYNNITRARRYIIENPGYTTPYVQVEWPNDSRGNAAWYDDGANEIHVSSGRQWRTDTHIHEYGHHFIDSLYEPDPPDPDYCNQFCDANDPQGSCSNPFSPGCGHCIWCQENAFDAWNEGWPNWLADIVTRDYRTRYQFDDGSPFQPLFTRSQESLNMCCQDNTFHNATATEGFVGALLRDIDDPNQDDHDGDGVFDLMCIGGNEIFYVIDVYQPITVSGFISGMLADHPEYTDRLWATAFNVGAGPFVANFPPDGAPPGAVASCDSPTHPLGTGGPFPCITFEWDPAPDDVTGCNAYSYVLTTNSAGQAPDQSADPVSTSGCRLSATLPSTTFAPGVFYFSIRAQDNAGNWSPQFATFGPFEIIDCNGSGILDLCDIDCSSSGIPGFCSFGPAICSGQPGCGASSDCNGNFWPDECDLANGTSEDCNGDGIPDECQPNVKHFTGAVSSDWADTANWQEGVLPSDGDHVCVAGGIPSGSVVFREDFRRLTTLNCESDFALDGAVFPWPELRLDERSFISGDLTMSGSSTLRVVDRLDVSGTLNWNDRDIYGPGTVNVYGGLNLNPPDNRTEMRSGAHLAIRTGAVDVHGNKYVELSDTSVLTIGAPVTWNYAGDFAIFTGGPTTTVDVDGTLRRTAGAGTATVLSFVDNSGLIHNQSGKLSLFYGGVHSGEVLSDPGTTLALSGNHDLLTPSSLTADDLELSASSSAFVRGAVSIADTLSVLGGTWTFTEDADPSSYGQHLVVTAAVVHFEAPLPGPALTFDTVSIGTGTYGGQVHFDSGQPVSLNALTFRNGVLYGADPISVEDSFVWNGGGTFTDGGPITFNCPVTIAATSSARYVYREFNNMEYATFLGQVGAAGTGVIRNRPGATMELRGDNTGISGGTTNNEGLIVKTQGTGNPAIVQYTVHNSGIIHVQSGWLWLGYTGGTNSGEILGDPGTGVNFRGTFEMSPTSRLIADDVTLSGGATSFVRGEVDIAGDLTIAGGNWTFTNESQAAGYGENLFVTSGAVRFDSPVPGPSLDFNAVTVAGNGPHFNTGQPVTINTLELRGNIAGPDEITVLGAFTWNTGALFAGGDVTAQGPVTLNSTGGQRTALRDFRNAGTFTFLNGGIALNNADFTNLPSGLIDITTDGTKFTLTTTSTLYNEGTLLKSGGAGTSAIQNHFRNAGTVEVRAGTLELYGGYNLTHVQTGGQTLLSGGALHISSAGVYALQGGDLAGSGAVTGDVENSGARVMPGLSAGTLAIDGDYDQTAGGTLDVEIGGASPGAFDVLTVSGTATLTGTLNVSTLNGYSPPGGTTFVVLSAGAINGAFDALTGAPGFEVSYTATEVILTSTGGALPGDLDGDCDVDLADLTTMLAHFGQTSGVGYEDGDLDGDGDVDLTDLTTLLAYFGTVC